MKRTDIINRLMFNSISDRLTDYIALQLEKDRDSQEAAIAYILGHDDYQNQRISSGEFNQLERELRRALSYSMPADIGVEDWTSDDFAECDLAQPVGVEFWVE